MGKIGDAETRIDDLESELAQLRGEFQRLTRELARANGDPTNPDAQSRAVALEKARAAVDDEIHLLSGDQGPIRIAQRDRDELVRQRDNQAATIESIEVEASRYGDLRSIEEAAGSMMRIFNRTGQPKNQSGDFETWCRGIHLWAKHLRQDIASLDARRRKLAEY